MSLATALADLASNRLSCADLVGACLAAVRDPEGEGSRVFTEIFANAANDAAREADERRRRGYAAGALAGLPISVKDLFDIEGTVTCAGSVALRDSAPASVDAVAVKRLRAAGAIVVGKTNMTEFAYSGVGLNPHFGTPRNPFDRSTGRIPGGSSSGAAVSITDGMAVAALGTDTGGSVRIPAALCGLVGWKPTAARVPRAGAIPLSTSLDSVGPIASSVADCARLDSILAAESAVAPPRPLDRVRLAVPRELLDADAPVAAAVGRALSRLSASGAEVREVVLPNLTNIPAVGASAVIVAAEAFAWHRALLQRAAGQYDPRVRVRIERGGEYPAWEYADALSCRESTIAAVDRELEGFDGWLMPTVPLIAPPLTAGAEDEAFFALNRRLLHNTSIVNFIDGCAFSIPCHVPGDAPVGLSLAGRRHSDAQILSLGASIEAALVPHTP